jgi:hypothetical protein
LIITCKIEGQNIIPPLSQQLAALGHLRLVSSLACDRPLLADNGEKRR